MGDIFKNRNTNVFPREEKCISTALKIRRKIWQIGPSSVASLMCLPYGIMLGWPSPTYPKLLPNFSPDTPINITIDNSAMITGFLMIGNTVGTPFSSMSVFGPKYGISMGLMLMLAGWVVMRFANSIYFLLGSRLLVGLGCGYGIGQLKMYIKEMSKPPYSETLTTLATFYTFSGVILAFTLGYLTSFKGFSTVAIILTSVIILICIVLPHSPKEYLVNGREKEAITVLLQINKSINADYEIQRLKVPLNSPSENMSFLQVCRDTHMRKFVIIHWILTILQQFTGAPATIVYAQLIFMESNCAYPEISAIGYSVLFFISSFIGIFFMNSFNKKACLFFSSICVTLALGVNITVFYFSMNDTFWKYTSLLTMFLFIFVHSTGLGVVPFMLTKEYFPPKALSVMSKAHTMQHSILALLITKIFQVLYDRYSLYVPFCLFMSISFFSAVFVWFFVPSTPPVLNKSIKPLGNSIQLISEL